MPYASVVCRTTIVGAHVWQTLFTNIFLVYKHIELKSTLTVVMLHS